VYKYLVLGPFLATFLFLIRKDRIYTIPFVLIIYSNINGLLDWEDFAIHGIVKFQDYGLLITSFLLATPLAARRPVYDCIPDRGYRRTKLFALLVIFWGYYFVEFAISVLIQSDFIWPLKLARVFFYGLIVFVALRQLERDPVRKFRLLINCLMAATLLFGVLYVIYNVFGVELYPKQSIEDFTSVGLGDVKRNFSGLPTFAAYFIILFTHNLVERKGNALLNVFGLALLVVCEILSLTRGFVILTGAIIVITLFYRKLSLRRVRRVFFIFGLAAALFFVVLPLIPDQIDAIRLRFGEFAASGGATQSHNFIVRAEEFSRIISNVLSFNPFLGFGFVNVGELHAGYYSSVLHGGSADNGVSNLIGTTGFIGVLLFALVLAVWLRVNLSVQMRSADPYAKINFIFIIFLIGSLVNGAGMSYMHAYAVFLAYDLIAFARLRKSRPVQMRSHVLPAS
jgi:hypothetical protein